MSAPTIVDVAKRAGVALSTASDILNGKLKGTPKTAARVRKAAKALGYRPNALARGLRSSRANAIGLVVPFRRPLFTSAVLTDYLAGIQSAQQETGLNLVLASRTYAKPGEAYGADLFAARAVDGLIVIGTRETFGRDVDADVRRLRALGCPLVWLHVYGGTEPVDRVALAPGGFDAVLAHLRARGHMRVGFLLGSVPGQRLDDALPGRVKALGISTRAAWIGSGDLAGGAAFEAALRILDRPAGRRPSALVCADDDLAVVALQIALALRLRVPRDLAIASLAHLSTGEKAAVPITTFGAPYTEVGRRAVLRLVERIARPDLPPETIEIPGGLLVREST